MKRKLWVVTGALLAVAAVEFGLVGSASAFFPWQHRKPDPPSCGRSSPSCKPTATPTRVPTATPAPPLPPISPPVCQPDAVHGHDQACDGQPASMQLTPDPLTIHCDGSEQSRVTVRVTDSRGRAVPDGTTVYFSPYNGSASPYYAQTRNGVASTSVRFYSEFFPYGPNVIVDVGALEAGVRIRCFPNSNQGPVSPPGCSGVNSPPSVSPPCATPTPQCSDNMQARNMSPPCGPTPYPTATPSWPCDPSGASPPSVAPLCGGELTLFGPSEAQAVGASFDVTLSITHAWQTWGLYNAQIAYDTSVLQVKSVARLPIAGCNDTNWAAPQTTPTLIVACVFQSSTDTGAADTITFQCLKDGSSVLHLVTPVEDKIQGSTLEDFDAVNIGTYLVDGPTVTCGAGGPVQTIAVPTNPSGDDVATAIASTPVPAATVTPVPTATNTPVPIG